jgi:hypothetical protein
MSVITVLRVFKNSSLITERGEFKISRVFDTAGACQQSPVSEGLDQPFLFI